MALPPMLILSGARARVSPGGVTVSASPELRPGGRDSSRILLSRGVSDIMEPVASGT